MALTYCFESHLVPTTLSKCRRNDLAVVDTEGNENNFCIKNVAYIYSCLFDQFTLNSKLKEGELYQCAN